MKWLYYAETKNADDMILSVTDDRDSNARYLKDLESAEAPFKP